MAGFGLGFAAGGFADAFQRGNEQQSLDQYRMQELKLQQQAQQNAEQRFQMSRIDAVRTEAMKGIDDAVSQLRIAGKEPAEITKTLMPWVEQVATLAKKSGLDPASAVYAPFTAAVARPPATQTAAAMAKAEAKPVVEKMTGLSGEQSIAIVEPGTGKVTYPEGGPDTSVPAPRADLQPGQIDTNYRDQLAKRAGMAPEALDVAGRAWASGNVSVLQNLSRGGNLGRQAVQNTRAWGTHVLMHEEGLSAQTAAEAINMNALEFSGMKAGAASLARREALVIGATTTAMQTAPRVLETSKNVPRTNYPAINSIILAFKEGTGDENVIRYGQALNTFINNYARAMGAGNAVVTDTARKEATDLLQRRWSEGQIQAGIDQLLNKELPSEIAGAQMGMRAFLRQKGYAVPPSQSGGGGATGASGGGEWKIERVQ